MSPWEILGWILVVVVSLVILLRVLIIAGDFMEKVVPELKAHRKRKRADKGKIICEKVEWEGLGADRVKVVCPEVATWRGGYHYRSYFCDEHSLRDRSNRAPLAFTEMGKARSAEAPVVVRSPRKPSTSPTGREGR